MPNCRAMRDGVIPALKAARTAFNFPLVNGSGASSTRRLREPSSRAGDFLPRRCCSAEATATNWSSSASVSRLIAFGRSLGRMCRTAALPAGDEGSGVTGGEKCSRPGGTGQASSDPCDLCPWCYLVAVIAGPQAGNRPPELQAGISPPCSAISPKNQAGADCCPNQAARSSDEIRLTSAFSIAAQATASDPPVSIPRHASSTT